MPVEHEALIARHADKGGWKINEEELRARLPADEASLVIGVLQREFPGLTETPLKLDGLQRSIKLGEEVFGMTPDGCVLVVVDSGKDRAKITRALAVGRVVQLEDRYNRQNPKQPKRIDMLQIEEGDIIALLKDSDDSTWPPYAKMMGEENISESEAIFRWLNDMNKPDSGVDPKVAPAESSRRYRLLVEMIRDRVKSDEKPVILFGVGHSGSLGQVKYEDVGVKDASETPQFCEIFRFGKDAKLEGTKRDCRQIPPLIHLKNNQNVLQYEYNLLLM